MLVNRTAIGLLYWRALAVPNASLPQVTQIFEHYIQRIGHPKLADFPKELPVIKQSTALPEVITALWLNTTTYFSLTDILFGGRLGELKLLNIILNSADDATLSAQALNIIHNDSVEKAISYKPYAPQLRHPYLSHLRTKHRQIL